jgi:Tat protein translocase TatB subunit
VFNVGGAELLVILLLALIVLGPQRLPDAARQIGKVMGDLRRMSSGFQQELRAALDDPTEAKARSRGDAFRPASPDAPAVTPVEPSANGTASSPAATTPPAKPTAARRRSAPLRAPGKPGRGSAS